VHVWIGFIYTVYWQVATTDLYKVPDAVPPIHAVSSHVATDKGPYKFRSIFSDNLQPIATRGKKAHGTLLVNIGCSSKSAPLSISYYNKISGGHIGSCRCSEEGLCRPSTALCLWLHRSRIVDSLHLFQWHEHANWSKKYVFWIWFGLVTGL